MTNKEIANLVRAYKGSIFVTVHGKDDPIYVKVVKRDLLNSLAGSPDVDMGFRFDVAHDAGWFDRT